MSQHYIEDCRTETLKNKEKWSVQGYSKAGGRTSFHIEPLKIVVDVGMSIKRKPKCILLTHKHTDHTGMLCSHSNRRIVKRDGQEDLIGTPCYMPEAAYKPLTVYNKAIYMSSFDDDRIYDEMKRYKSEDYWRMQGLHPFTVSHGETFKMPGIKDIEVEVHPAYHNTTSNGYGFLRVKKKLKPDYIPLTKTKEGRELIKKMRLDGVEIEMEIKEPQLIIYCDSTIDNLRKHDGWKKYPVIFVECTGFPGDVDAETMTKRDHSHLDLLRPIMWKNKDKQWFLIHTSSSFEDDVLLKHQEDLRAEGLDVTIWIN